MNIKVIHVPANPNLPIAVKELSDNAEIQHQQMYDLVQGWLEIVPTPTHEITIWCNEEGKLQNLPINKRINELWRSIINTQMKVPSFLQLDVIVGNVFISGPISPDGDLSPLPDSVIQLLTQ